MSSDIEQMAADAKERIHRGIGQRWRWARHDIARKAAFLHKSYALRQWLDGHPIAAAEDT